MWGKQNLQEEIVGMHGLCEWLCSPTIVMICDYRQFSSYLLGLPCYAALWIASHYILLKENDARLPNDGYFYKEK